MGIVNSNQIHTSWTEKAINALFQYLFQAIYEAVNPVCPFIFSLYKTLFSRKNLETYEQQPGDSSFCIVGTQCSLGTATNAMPLRPWSQGHSAHLISSTQCFDIYGVSMCIKQHLGISSPIQPFNHFVALVGHFSNKGTGGIDLILVALTPCGFWADSTPLFLLNPSVFMFATLFALFSIFSTACKPDKAD